MTSIDFGVVMENTPYKPNFPDIYKNVLTHYSEALAPRRSKRATESFINMAYTYFIALTNMVKSGCLSPNDKNLIYKDIEHALNIVNKEYLEKKKNIKPYNQLPS